MTGHMSVLHLLERAAPASLRYRCVTAQNSTPVRLQVLMPHRFGHLRFIGGGLIIGALATTTTAAATATEARGPTEPEADEYQTYLVECK